MLDQKLLLQVRGRRHMRTARVMAGRQKYASRSLSLSNNMACCWGAENPILSDQKLLHSICSANLGDQLRDLRIVEASISTDDEETTFCAFGDGEEDAGDEGLAIVWLLKDGDLFTEARPAQPSAYAKRWKLAHGNVVSKQQLGE